MYALLNGNVGATAKSVHSRHDEVIKFVDISLETMFRAAQLRKVCYRQTIVTSASRSFSPQFLKCSRAEKSVNEEKRRREREKRKERKSERIDELRAYYTLKCKLTYL